MGTPLVAARRIRTLRLVSAHIAERFGLSTIIVLGESVVSVAGGIVDVEFELSSRGRAQLRAGDAQAL